MMAEVSTAIIAASHAHPTRAGRSAREGRAHGPTAQGWHPGGARHQLSFRPVVWSSSAGQVRGGWSESMEPAAMFSHAVRLWWNGQRCKRRQGARGRSRGPPAWCTRPGSEGGPDFPQMFGIIQFDVFADSDQPASRIIGRSHHTGDPTDQEGGTDEAPVGAPKSVLRRFCVHTRYSPVTCTFGIEPPVTGPTGRAGSHLRIAAVNDHNCSLRHRTLLVIDCRKVQNTTEHPKMFNTFGKHQNTCLMLKRPAPQPSSRAPG